MMKKMMILVSAIMMAATVNAKSIETKPFSSVKLGVPANVRVLYGDKYTVDVRSAEPMEAENVKVEVENGEMKISLINGQANAETQMRIIITAPVDPELKASRDMVMKTVKRSSSDRDLAVKD